MHSLDVHLNKQLVATLTIDGKEDRYSFVYENTWIEEGYPISPHLPFHTVISSASIKRFLQNLLPEGKGLEDLTAYTHLSKYNIYGILQAIGFETSGALYFGNTRDNEVDKFRPITEEELTGRIDEIEKRSIIIWDRKPRLSLAGVQEKLPVLLKDGVLGLAEQPELDTYSEVSNPKKSAHRHQRIFLYGFGACHRPGCRFGDFA